MSIFANAVWKIIIIWEQSDWSTWKYNGAADFIVTVSIRMLHILINDQSLLVTH